MSGSQYDSSHGHLRERAQREVREETYGEDATQSWTTATAKRGVGA